MLVNIFLHSIKFPLAREIKNIEELGFCIEEIGFSRVEKIIITDFRNEEGCDES